MKNDRVFVPVIFGTAYLLLYLVLLSFDPAFRLAFLMLLFSPVMLVWMVISILRNGKPSRYHFDDRWYEDMDE